MHIALSRDQLSFGVGTVLRAVSPKSTLPILSGIKMEAFGTQVKFTATDLEFGIETIIDARVETPGSIVVPARYFAEISRRLPAQDVTLKFNAADSSLEISSGRASFSIKTMDPDEFPSLPELSDGSPWYIPEADLRKLIRETALAASTEDARPFLTGVSVTTDPGSITMVATDSFRLAYRTMPLSDDIRPSRTCIIPARMLNELARNLTADGTRDVSVVISERHAMFRVGDTTYVTRLLEGQFPDYKQVLPKSYNTRITADTAALLAAVERTSLLGKDESGKDEYSTVRLAMSSDGEGGGFVTVSASTTEVGRAREELAVRMEGPDVQVSIRARYLTEVLKVLSEDQVTLDFTGPLNPIALRPLGDDNYIYLIMPLTSY